MVCSLNRRRFDEDRLGWLLLGNGRGDSVSRVDRDVALAQRNQHWFALRGREALMSSWEIGTWISDSGAVDRKTVPQEIRPGSLRSN